jgi:hypothetical protein
MLSLRKFTIQLTVLACLPFAMALHAQTNANSTYIPNVIPPSPNAAALMKFSDIPVSPYTGTAEVTVPIYTVEGKGINVPVNLAYHTGGVKVKDEASWVGLGWALDAGGMVSRTIMDHDDFGSTATYFTTQVPQLSGDISISQPAQASGAPNLGPWFFDFFCNYLVTTSAGTENLTEAFDTGNDQWDMEPDIFSYSFPGHSGKFIITRLGQIVMQKQDNIVIQCLNNGQSFTITDEQGNNYYFTVQELTQTTGGAQPVSSWLLSKVISQQHDSVMFTYASGGATASLAPDIYQANNQYCAATQGFTQSNGSPTLYYNQTLQAIDWANGHMQFAFDASRSDLQGGYKLDSILIYSKNAAGAETYLKQDNFYYTYFNGSYPAGTDTLEFYRLKLDSVKEKSGTAGLPPYSFVYNNVNPGNGSQKHGYNIDHWGFFNGTANTQFIPTVYVEYQPSNSAYPSPQYFSYTGANRLPNLSFMQTFSLDQVTYPTGGSTVFQYGANDYDYTNSAPGGTDGFSYIQLNSMDSIINIIDHGTTSGTINLTNVYPLLPGGSSQTNVTINIAFMYQNNYGGTGEPPFPTVGSGKIQFNITGPGVNATADIASATCDPGSPVCTVSIPLTITGANNTTFSWSGTIASSIDTTVTYSETHVAITYQVTNQMYNLLENNSFISPASGLRIQSITNYKDAVTPISERTYSYNYLQDKLGTGNPQQYSYGRIMAFPSYVRYQSTSTSTGGVCTQLSLFSSSNVPLTGVVQGNVVGYDQVTEYQVDPITGVDIGKTVYSYYNSSDTSRSYGGFRLPGTMAMGYNLNGLLRSKVAYADYGGVYFKVDETDNYYHTTNRTVYYSPKYQYIFYNGSDGGGNNGLLCTPDTAVNAQTLACFYPSIKSEKILNDSTIHITYQQGDTTKSVISREYKYYDNPAHYLLTRSMTVDSKGDTLVTRIRYPQDYIPAGNNTWTGNTILDTMIGRNIVTSTIEKQDSLYYPGSSTGYITGAQLSLYRILSANHNTIVPDRTYKLDIQSPITNFQPFAISNNTTTIDSRNRQMISFDAYDANNNIQQYTTTDQNPVTIIWDYNHVYPIAQAKNAVASDVAYTSFEADGTGNWTIGGTGYVTGSGLTGNQCYTISSGAVTCGGLNTAQTYICSYWSTAGSLSVTGTTSINQGKTITIGVATWTYYEHTLTGTGSITVSGGGNIDELRLYPKAAQMTTLTYSPLAGTATTCDMDNKVNYYFYDEYQRLLRIKDQDGNIIKTIQYHYANQNPANQ